MDMLIDLITQEALHCAAERIQPYLPPSPLIRSDYYSRRVGANVFLKLEIMQPTHSFKVRGAFNAMLSLPLAQRERGVITSSQGNHGLGVAYAGATLDIPVTVFLAHTTPESRLNMLRKLGAEIVLHGNSWDEANQRAMDVAFNDKRAYIHPFNDPNVMAGQGTILLELLSQLPSLDVLVASIGGGGLLSGMLSAAQHLSPRTRVIGVETIGADCMSRSREAGAIVELPAITSVATSLGARRTEPLQFQLVTSYAEDLVVVPDEAAIREVMTTLNEEKLVIEPAAACTLAALVSGQIHVEPHESVAVILCGANVSGDQLRDWLRQS
jgi:threonine dehydratase